MPPMPGERGSAFNPDRSRVPATRPVLPATARAAGADPRGAAAPRHARAAQHTAQARIAEGLAFVVTSRGSVRADRDRRRGMSTSTAELLLGLRRRQRHNQRGEPFGGRGATLWCCRTNRAAAGRSPTERLAHSQDSEPSLDNRRTEPDRRGSAEARGRSSEADRPARQHTCTGRPRPPSRFANVARQTAPCCSQCTRVSIGDSAIARIMAAGPAR